MAIENEIRQSCCDDIVRVKQTLYGDDGDGLVKTVQSIEVYMQRQIGAITLAKWLLSFIGIVNIVILIKLFLRH